MTPQIDPYSGNVPRHDPKAFAEYISAVTKLAAEGKPVQYELMGINPLAWNSVFQQSGPAWDWSGANYRIDPASRPRTMRPWAGPEDIPKVPAVWLQFPTGTVGQITEITQSGITVGRIQHGWSAVKSLEYSLDRITWAKCEVEDAS